MRDGRARSWRDGWVVFALALAARAAAVFWAHGRFPPTADGSYYHVLAQRLAEGQGYTWAWPDGAVTFAAHYPVGYPAALALTYTLVGASPTAAMALNASLGAVGCLAVQRILAVHGGRRAALVGGLLAALHPGLIAYTPALMTEGIAAALLACGGWAVASGRARWAHSRTTVRWLLPLAVGALLGLTALVRPQCLLLAPLFGALVVPRGRWRELLLAALLAAVAALGVCSPWTARNCVRMNRCALVSVNGGWNLLIGTDPRGRGGWAPLDVPPACRQVFDEAEKDRCFQQAALERIVAAPAAWLSLVPAKLSVTLDYAGAGGWYLHESNGEAFGGRAKVVLGTVETLTQRLVLLLALLAVWPGGPSRKRRRARLLRFGLLVAGLVSALWLSATVAYLALVGLALWRRPGLSGARPIVGTAVATVASLLLVHAVFFGAGRYQLVGWLLLCGLGGLGWHRWRRIARCLRP